MHKYLPWGIHLRAGSMSGLAEEAPIAYKDVDHVIEVVHGAGIAKKVAWRPAHGCNQGVAAKTRNAIGSG